MKLIFYGAAREVTGSCHYVLSDGKKMLVDCGLQQGRDEHENQQFDFVPGLIDYVFVTHAHIDHSGRLPLLVKQGFRGKMVSLYSGGAEASMHSYFFRARVAGVKLFLSVPVYYAAASESSRALFFVGN